MVKISDNGSGCQTSFVGQSYHKNNSSWLSSSSSSHNGLNLSSGSAKSHNFIIAI